MIKVFLEEYVFFDTPHIAFLGGINKQTPHKTVATMR